MSLCPVRLWANEQKNMLRAKINAQKTVEQRLGNELIIVTLLSEQIFLSKETIFEFPAIWLVENSLFPWDFLKWKRAKTLGTVLLYWKSQCVLETLDILNIRIFQKRIGYTLRYTVVFSWNWIIIQQQHFKLR